ncbi:MAG: hypothetical protein OSJ66_07310 [Clostridia bacterium]|nr:hypothetical protein [Clostridia bacterium]
MLSKEKTENKEELLRKISREQYGDEYFIEKALLTYKNQEEKTYTFFRDDKQEDLLRKYNFCQRPEDTNMSLRRFTENGEIEGYMSESLAEKFGLIKVTLNEFIHKFVQLIIKENLELKKRERESREKEEILNKMKRKYKIALFLVIRNSQVLTKGKKLGKTEKEINKMAYETMCEVLTMIDFNRAEEIYKQGKTTYEDCKENKED